MDFFAQRLVSYCSMEYDFESQQLKFSIWPVLLQKGHMMALVLKVVNCLRVVFMYQLSLPGGI